MNNPFIEAQQWSSSRPPQQNYMPQPMGFGMQMPMQPYASKGGGKPNFQASIRVLPRDVIDLRSIGQHGTRPPLSEDATTDIVTIASPEFVSHSLRLEKLIPVWCRAGDDYEVAKSRSKVIRKLIPIDASPDNFEAWCNLVSRVNAKLGIVCRDIVIPTPPTAAASTDKSSELLSELLQAIRGNSSQSLLSSPTVPGAAAVAEFGTSNQKTQLQEVEMRARQHSDREVALAREAENRANARAQNEINTVQHEANIRLACLQSSIDSMEMRAKASQTNMQLQGEANSAALHSSSAELYAANNEAKSLRDRLEKIESSAEFYHHKEMSASHEQSAFLENSLREKHALLEKYASEAALAKATFGAQAVLLSPSPTSAPITLSPEGASSGNINQSPSPPKSPIPSSRTIRKNDDKRADDIVGKQVRFIHDGRSDICTVKSCSDKHYNLTDAVGKELVLTRAHFSNNCIIISDNIESTPPGKRLTRARSASPSGVALPIATDPTVVASMSQEEFDDLLSPIPDLNLSADLSPTSPSESPIR